MAGNPGDRIRRDAACDGGIAGACSGDRSGGVQRRSCGVAGLAAIQLLWRARLRAELGLALAAGRLYGVSDSLMKLGTASVRAELGSFEIQQLATLQAPFWVPAFHLYWVGNLSGFLLEQTAFGRGRLAVIVPTTTLGSTLVPVRLGVTLLGEPLGIRRLCGVAAMGVGVLVLIRFGPGYLTAAEREGPESQVPPAQPARDRGAEPSTRERAADS